MTRPGEFNAVTRATIMEACGYRCVGCGRNAPLNCQHRRARGMGGTSSAIIGQPSNGVILCGSGTICCHGWAEAHPVLAGHLGWRLGRFEDPCRAPWWTRYGWRLWNEDLSVTWLDDVDVPDLADRTEAITAYMRDRGHSLIP